MKNSSATAGPTGHTFEVAGRWTPCWVESSALTRLRQSGVRRFVRQPIRLLVDLPRDTIRHAIKALNQSLQFSLPAAFALPCSSILNQSSCSHTGTLAETLI